MNSVKSLSLLAFSILFVFLLGAGCTQPATPPVSNKTVEFGDQVAVDYVLLANITDYVTGVTSETLIDTSLSDVARAAGRYNANRTYEPLQVSMENNNGLIPGFTRALVGMKEGENKTFFLKPADAYGEYNASKVFSLKKLYNLSIIEEIPINYFRANNISVENDTVLKGKYWNAMVLNVTNSSVAVRYLPELNESFVFNGLDQRVAAYDDANITLEIIAQVGKRYATQSPSKDSVQVLAVAENETDITFDSNHPLAGKTLEFTVFVRQITKAAGQNSSG